jgi:hypothetical protein
MSISDFLNSLGSTPDEVADSLLIMGIKGERDNPCFCPIIKAIYFNFPELPKGLKVVVVPGHTKYIYGSIPIYVEQKAKVTWSDIQTIDPKCPDAVSEFIMLFDVGKYQFLIGKSQEEIANDVFNRMSLEERMAVGLL